VFSHCLKQLYRSRALHLAVLLYVYFQFVVLGLDCEPEITIICLQTLFLESFFLTRRASESWNNRITAGCSSNGIIWRSHPTGHVMLFFINPWMGAVGAARTHAWRKINCIGHISLCVSSSKASNVQPSTQQCR
jgi:hypothetical protein